MVAIFCAKRLRVDMHLGYSVPITIEEPASWQTRFAWVCGSQRWLDLVIAVALPGTTGKSGCRTHRGLYDQARECLRGAPGVWSEASLSRFPDNGGVDGD